MHYLVRHSGPCATSDDVVVTSLPEKQRSMTREMRAGWLLAGEQGYFRPPSAVRVLEPHARAAIKHVAL